MVCKWQVEIDDYATRVLEKHWPNVRRWRDITTFPPDADSDDGRTWWKGGFDSGCEGKHFTKRSLQVDLIAGGFPCQDLSYAGRGAGLDGERSGLFFEALRVVRQLRPRYVLLENVAALLTRGLDRVLGELGQIGYDAEWHCIPAAAVGAPHIRDRVFVIGVDSNANRNSQPALPVNAEVVRVPEFCSSVADTNGISTQGQRTTRQQVTRTRLLKVKPQGGCNGTGEQWAIEPAVCELVDGVSPGLVRYAGRVATGVPNRVAKLRGLGNAVVPQVAEWIGRQIIEHYNTETDPEKR